MEPTVEGPSTSATNVPLANVSPLIRLPRELRDLVFEYALSFEGGLIADVINATGQDSTGNDSTAVTRFHAKESLEKMKANQLRLVCRQFYAESNKLELRYNDITFVDTNGQSNAFTNFVHFYKNCPAAQLQFVRRVTILDSHKSFIQREELEHEALAVFPSFCKHFPNALFVVRGNIDFSNPMLDYTQCMNWMYDYGALDKACPFRFTDVVSLIESEAAIAEWADRRFLYDRQSNIRVSCSHEFKELQAKEELARLYEGEELEAKLKLVKQLHEDGI
jgi:hypothetical protein